MSTKELCQRDLERAQIELAQAKRQNQELLLSLADRQSEYENTKERATELNVELDRLSDNLQSQKNILIISRGVAVTKRKHFKQQIDATVNALQERSRNFESAITVLEGQLEEVKSELERCNIAFDEATSDYYAASSAYDTDEADLTTAIYEEKKAQDDVDTSKHNCDVADESLDLTKADLEELTQQEAASLATFNTNSQEELDAEADLEADERNATDAENNANSLQEQADSSPEDEEKKKAADDARIAATKARKDADDNKATKSARLDAARQAKAYSSSKYNEVLKVKADKESEYSQKSKDLEKCKIALESAVILRNAAKANRDAKQSTRDLDESKKMLCDTTRVSAQQIRDKKKGEYDTLKLRLEVLQYEKLEIEGEIDDIKKTEDPHDIIEVEQAFKEKEIEVSELKDEINQKKALYLALDAECTRLNDDILPDMRKQYADSHKLVKELEDLVTFHTLKYEAIVEEEKKINLATPDRLENDTERFAELQKRIDEAEEKLTVLSDDAFEYESKADDAEKEVKALEEQIKAADAATLTAEDEVERLSKEYEKEKKVSPNVDKIGESADDLAKKIQDLTLKIGTARDRSNAAKARHGDAKKKEQALETLKVADAKKVKAEANRDEFMSKLVKLKEEEYALSEKLGAYQVKISQLQNDMYELQKLLDFSDDWQGGDESKKDRSFFDIVSLGIQFAHKHIRRRKATRAPIDVHAYYFQNATNKVTRVIRQRDGVTLIVYENGTSERLVEYQIPYSAKETPISEPDSEGYYYVMMDVKYASKKIHSIE